MMTNEKNRELFANLKTQIGNLGPIKKVGTGFDWNPELNTARARRHDPPSLVGESFKFAKLSPKEKRPVYTGFENPDELLELYYTTSSTVAAEIMDGLLGISVVKTESNSCYITIDSMAQALQGRKFFLPCKDVTIAKGTQVNGLTGLGYQHRTQTVGVKFEAVTIEIEDVIYVNDIPVIVLTKDSQVLILFI